MIFERDGAALLVVDFLRDIADLDLSSFTDHQIKGLEECEGLRSAAGLSFAVAHAVLAKDSEKRCRLIMSHFVMPRLLFWIGGTARLTVSGSIPNFLKEAAQVMVHFVSVRMDVSSTTGH